MSKLVLHGFYGMGNLGDNAILQAMLNGFHQGGINDVTVLCQNPSQANIENQARYIHSESRRVMLSRLYHIATSSVFVLGGGGLLKDYGDDSRNIKNWLRPLQWAIWFGVPCALGFIGVMPPRFEKSKALLIQTLNRISLIIVRDTESASVLKEIGVTTRTLVVPDPALTLCKPSQRSIDQQKSSLKIAVFLRHWYRHGNHIDNPEIFDAALTAIAQTLDDLIEKSGAKVTFIPCRICEYDDDRKIAHLVAARMTHGHVVEIQETSPSPEKLIEMMESFSVVLGMRLHPLILAAAKGIPIVGLSYMPKVSSFFAQLNSSEYVLPMEHLTADKLTRKIRSVLDDYNVISKNICQRIHEMQSEVSGGFAQICQLAKKH